MKRLICLFISILFLSITTYAGAEIIHEIVRSIVYGGNTGTSIIRGIVGDEDEDLPDWKMLLTSSIEPDIDSTDELGNGTFVRNSVAYGWEQESAVTQFAVTAANSRCSLIDGSSWYWDTDHDISAYAGTGYKIELIDDAGLRAVALLSGAVGTGEEWTNLMQTGEGDYDDGGVGDIEGWVSTGTNTTTTEDLGGGNYALKVIYDGSDTKGSQRDWSSTNGLTEDIGMGCYRVNQKTAIDGNAVIIRLHNGYRLFYITTETQTSLTNHEVYFSGKSKLTANFSFTTPGDICYLDDSIIERLTECAATGVHVYKVSDPTTEGWDYDASFDMENIEYCIITQTDVSSSRLAWHAVDMPRIHPVRGILLEPEGTNKCLYLRDLSNAVWVASGSPVKTQDETGIDGVSNVAWTLEDDSNTGYEYLYQTITIPDDSNTHCVSVFVLKDNDETRFPEVFAKCQSGATGVTHAVQLNTKTGATFERGDDGSDSCGTVDYGDWWRLWVNVTNNNSGNTEFLVRIHPAQTTTWGIAEVAGIGSIVVDWPQVELDQAFPSSPIYTEGSEVTRATESGYPEWTQPTNMFAESLGSELLPNNDFETYSGTQDDSNTDSFTSWNIHANESNYVDATATVKFGSNAVKLYYGGSGNSDIEMYINSYLTDMSLYKLNIWGKGAIGGEDLGMYVYAGDGCHLGPLTTSLTTSYTNNNLYFVFDHSVGIAALLRFYVTLTEQTVYIDGASVKEVTNGWDNMLPHATIVLFWKPLYNYNAISTTYVGVFGTDDGTRSIMTWYSGSLQISDGTLCSSKSGINYEANNWYKCVAKYAYITDNYAKQTIGVDTGSGVSWGTEVNYDGAFGTDSKLHLGYGLLGPQYITDVRIYRRILTDEEINAIPFPE